MMSSLRSMNPFGRGSRGSMGSPYYGGSMEAVHHGMMDGRQICGWDCGSFADHKVRQAHARGARGITTGETRIRDGQRDSSEGLIGCPRGTDRW